MLHDQIVFVENFLNQTYEENVSQKKRRLLRNKYRLEFFFNFKGTVKVVFRNPPMLKSGKSDSQLYPSKLCLIKHELDIHVFQSLLQQQCRNYQS